MKEGSKNKLTYLLHTNDHGSLSNLLQTPKNSFSQRYTSLNTLRAKCKTQPNRILTSENAKRCITVET